MNFVLHTSDRWRQQADRPSSKPVCMPEYIFDAFIQSGFKIKPCNFAFNMKNHR